APEIAAGDAPSARPRQRRGNARQTLQRQTVVHAAAADEGASTCAACGAALQTAGADTSEWLEYACGRYQLVRHVRPRLQCSHCGQMLQAPALEPPIAGTLVGPGMLAHVLMSKYVRRLPLHRQSRLY